MERRWGPCACLLATSAACAHGGRAGRGLRGPLHCHATPMQCQARGSVTPTLSGAAVLGKVTLMIRTLRGPTGSSSSCCPCSFREACLTQSHTGEARRHRLSSGLPARPSRCRQAAVPLDDQTKAFKGHHPCPGASPVPSHTCQPRRHTHALTYGPGTDRHHPRATANPNSPILAAHQNLPGNKTVTETADAQPAEPSSLEVGTRHLSLLRFIFGLISPGDSNMQPRLRTTWLGKGFQASVSTQEATWKVW